MANYTIELRDIVNSGINIFDFNYPFYDESKRREFEEKFIKHFYFHEIGSPTPERFKWYLEDKMNTVFPYYNELFKSATIEYEVLDNYKLTETYTRNVERNENSMGVSSSVGRFEGNQETENNQDRITDTTNNVDSIGTDNETENGSYTKTVNEDKSQGKEEKKRFLDTPQGKLDLSDSKYLTTLNHDTSEITEDNTTTDNGSNDKSVDRSNSLSSESIGNETVKDKLTGSTHDEQKTTQDNNTRHYSKGDSAESYTLVRKGNIGVDTDSDAIEKHNRLQKTLRNIEKMFFDECEDLFMLVW